jgi:cytochrome c peroxidase
MHTAQMGSLEEVVSFFNQSGDPAGYPGANELHALGLTAAEQAALVAFLQTLEGEPAPVSWTPPM